MIDEDIKALLIESRNLLEEINENQKQILKQISADVAIQATQAERAVEIARLQKTALKAIKESHCWLRQSFSTHWQSWRFWENRLERLCLIEQSTWGIKALFL